MPDRDEWQDACSILPVPSPCVRNCCLDEDDICLGCFRSLEEIMVWGTVDDEKKHRILQQAANRKKKRTKSDPDL